VAAEEFVQNYVTAQALQIAAAVVVVLINTILKGVLKELSIFERCGDTIPGPWFRAYGHISSPSEHGIKIRMLDPLTLFSQIIVTRLRMAITGGCSMVLKSLGAVPHGDSPLLRLS
jgi:hypothetical protein